MEIKSYITKLFQKSVDEYFIEHPMDVLIQQVNIDYSDHADYQFLIKKTTDMDVNIFVDKIIYKVLQYDELKAIKLLKLEKIFINITLNNDFINESIIDLMNKLVNNKKIFDIYQDHSFYIVDYSSPNIAKSLHIGHLRSTIIGESLVRLLKTAKYKVCGINHVGDWGTQFGMIINYLKTKYCNDEKQIIEVIEKSTTDDLTNFYRDAKNKFDEDHNFASETRKQACLLQQNDGFNMKCWEKICKISSNEYTKIYNILNIRNLVECGESFYKNIIPSVLNILCEYIQINNGAKIIKFDGWAQPLIIVKSDGGYTYDTTDLCALYYRLVIIGADNIIYVVDSGQKIHFDMCFEVAKKIGWANGKKLTHIGFGFVCGQDGKKLKTRSGDVVKMMDVIDEVIIKSSEVIELRAQNKIGDKTNYYENITEFEKREMSRKIGINTLKYFDLCHTYSSNYKYDPSTMFRFNGDTCVYLMYTYARINGIIEKSGNNVSEINISKFIEITQEERKLILYIMRFQDILNSSIQLLNTNLLTKYIFELCTIFNGFITCRKVIGSENEKFRIGLCLLTSKIISEIFEILSLEHVKHI